MSESERIHDQLHRTFHGMAWHGPAVLELIGGLSAREAARRPVAGAHTIWEIVLHIGVWKGIARRRIRGETIRSLAPAEDWPAVADTGEAAWQQALDWLRKQHGELEAEVRQLPEARLSEIVQGDREQSIDVLLHGIVQHDLYHAGQIALLKRA